jgi:hypothetical protein
MSANNFFDQFALGEKVRIVPCWFMKTYLPLISRNNMNYVMFYISLVGRAFS